MNEPAPTPGKPGQPIVFTPRQLEVHELLREHSSESFRFHEWYRSALETLDSKTPDRVSQAAHSIRELCDKLPTKLGIPVFTSPVAFIKPLQSKFLTVKKSSYQDGWRGNINDDLGDVLRKIEEVFRLVNEPARKDRLKIALTSSDVFSTWLSKQQLQSRDLPFKRIGDFFQNAAHHNEFFDETMFREWLDTFETLLLNYLKPCTAAQHLELLALIKQEPTDANKATLKRLIDSKAANLLFFFQKLDNPAWLDHLVEKGWFTDLPGPQPTNDGGFLYNLHIPLTCLPRLAPVAPEVVTRILVQLEMPNNPRVGDQILQTMAVINNRECIRQLQPLIAQLRNNLGRASWFSIEELLENWFKIEAFIEAFEMAELFLFASVDSSASEGAGQASWLARQVSEKILPPIADRFPMETAALLFRSLSHWAERVRSQYNPTNLSPDDPPSYWIDDFKSPSPTYRELESLLAAGLYAAASKIYAQGNIQQILDIEKLLSSDPWNLFRRMRWQLYADFPQFTLERARAEVVPRIHLMNQIEFIHDFEFASLLESHVLKHGASFLSPDEVRILYETVMAGPLDEEGNFADYYDKGLFLRKQLQPVYSILTEDQKAVLATTGPGVKRVEMEDYKPYSTRVHSYEVVLVAPPEADAMDQMDDEKLWDFLNNWEPRAEFLKDGNWVREDLQSLAGKFADLVALMPERFTPASQWWKRSTRPLMLYQVLKRASDHFVQKQHDEKNAMPSPSDDEWGTWLGIIEWILERKKVSEARTATDAQKQLDWSYGWSSISRLLRMIIRSNYSIPDSRLGPLRAVLEHLIGEESESWDGETRSGMNDWYATAINSERGNAIEALVYLALRRKNEGKAVEPWILNLIRHCLERPKESPATFSLLGVHLGPAIYAFGDDFRKCSELLFSNDKPVHRKAAIISHFRYSQPHKLLLDTLPKLPEMALEILKSDTAAIQNSNEKQEWRDFGSRLGVHLAFYFWTGAFPSNQAAQKLQNTYFASASKSARKGLIHHIAQAFRNANESLDRDIQKRTMHIWELRVEKIKSALKSGHQPRDEFDGELSEFLDWLDCECFPFDWRLSKAEEAIRLVSKTPQPYGLMRTIIRFGQSPKLLGAGMKLFHAILAKPSDELRWSVNYKELGPVLSSGLLSPDDAVRRCSKECLDRVLLLGCSDFAQLVSSGDGIS